MSEEQNASAREIRRLIRLLEKMRALAQESTMTGALRGGHGYAVQQYNGIVASLALRGLVLPQYFPPLAEDASMGSVGFASAQLAEYLKEEFPEVAESAGAGSPGFGFGGGFGDMFEHFLAGRGQAAGPVPPPGAREQSRPAADSAETARAGAPREPAGGAPSGDLHRRLTEVAARMQAVSERLQRGELSPEEYGQLAAELSRLGQENSRLAQEAAAGRSRGTTPGEVDRDVNVDVDV